MSDFFVKSPHTKEECLQALDDSLALGPDVLAKFEYGCGAGDHTAYGIVKASSESEALSNVPESVRAKATAVSVSQISAEQIRAYHTAA